MKIGGDEYCYILEAHHYAYVTSQLHRRVEFKDGVHRETDRAFHHDRGCLTRAADKYDLVDRTPYLGS